MFVQPGGQVQRPAPSCVPAAPLAVLSCRGCVLRASPHCGHWPTYVTRRVTCRRIGGRSSMNCSQTVMFASGPAQCGHVRSGTRSLRRPALAPNAKPADDLWAGRSCDVVRAACASFHAGERVRLGDGPHARVAQSVSVTLRLWPSGGRSLLATRRSRLRAVECVRRTDRRPCPQAPTARNHARRGTYTQLWELALPNKR